MAKILKFLFSRMVIVALLILFQAAVLIGVIWKLTEYFVYLYAVLTILSVCVVVWLVSKKDNPSYKLAWTIPILIFPLFGGIMYLMFGGNTTSKKFRKEMSKVANITLPLIKQDENIMEEIAGMDRSIANQSRYISDYSFFPIYKNTTTEYLSPGEIKFERLKQELEKAKHYIFMEYFIIEGGQMWDGILEILLKKANAGLDVRVLYDDVGCLQTLPTGYNNTLEKMGIKCKVFNPFKPELSVRMNNRDHRKIVVIDGHTGFTGGINLADEYINVYEKHGHWKDASVMIKGEAVWNLTIMFLQVWDYIENRIEDYEKYRPERYHPEPFKTDGFVQPYGDSPLDQETVGEYVYLNMITHAREYVYINTPYLIVDHELVTAMSLAAKSGVDVRIVTPGHADKWYVHLLTQAYYPQLVAAGVKIYEYTPGFIHSKTFVSDDELAVIGTINLDYRSLYLHFECGVWMYKSSAVAQLKEDFLRTLEVCSEMTSAKCNSVGWIKRIIRGILRVFAPLM